MNRQIAKGWCVSKKQEQNFEAEMKRLVEYYPAWHLAASRLQTLHACKTWAHVGMHLRHPVSTIFEAATTMASCSSRHMQKNNHLNLYRTRNAFTLFSKSNKADSCCSTTTVHAVAGCSHASVYTIWDISHTHRHALMRRMMRRISQVMLRMDMQDESCSLALHPTSSAAI